MRGKMAALGALCLATAPALAVETGNFEVRTTADLVELCSTDPDDPLHAEAMQFCYGYVAGASHFHQAMVHNNRMRALACPREQVTRRDLVATFLDWTATNPQYMDELPVETVARATVATWPCDR
jgi:Rap1a immunity proteins